MDVLRIRLSSIEGRISAMKDIIKMKHETNLYEYNPVELLKDEYYLKGLKKAYNIMLEGD